MQPTEPDNQAVEPIDNTAPADPVPTSDSPLATDELAQAPVSTAMSDALAATAAATAVSDDSSSATLPPSATDGSDAHASTDTFAPASTDTGPIFGPTPASEALANDPLSTANNSTPPAVPQASSEQAIISSADAVVADASSEEPVLTTPSLPGEPTLPPAPTSQFSGSDELPAITAPPTPASPDDLLSMKQQALQQLSPLVSHLDQSPEEKFRTTMMMLQATDNPGLVKEAYDLAQQITDEKVRAQALLDVVNEINYFTHQQNQPSQPPVFND